MPGAVLQSISSGNTQKYFNNLTEIQIDTMRKENSLKFYVVLKLVTQ